MIGTNNVDNCSRYCQSPATFGLMSNGWIWRGFWDDKGYRKVRIVFIIGANPCGITSRIATRVKRSHKLHGQKLIVADLRKHEMAERV